VANLVARDEKNDLAVVRSNLLLSSVVLFRDGPVRPGDEVVALGYPLSGLLATAANLTTGNVSALAGLRDDSRYLQISAPVQPGNSGGPLLDMSGHLIGIVTARLDDLNTMRSTGAIPQNVNFALKTDVARTFLDSQGIGYQTARSEQKLSAADVGEIARPSTVKIECSGPNDDARTAPPPPPPASPPPVQQVKSLPACESTPVYSLLTRIGRMYGIEVFTIDGRSLGSNADMNFCTGWASTSAGKLQINYAVNWKNREAGRFGIQMCFDTVCN